MAEQPASSPAWGHSGLLIILAPVRSFTTLASAMLGQHPQMFGLPETFLFTVPTMQDLWRLHQGTSRLDGLSRAVAQLIFHAQTESSIEKAHRWMRGVWPSTAEVMRALAAAAAPRILVEKTPQTSERVENLQRIAAEFPESRYLHLVRHPFGQVMSRLQRRINNAAKRPSAPAHISLIDIAERLREDPQMYWYRCHSNVTQFLATIDGHQQLRVRGEDLVSEPDVHLRRIADWLELRSDYEAIESMKHPEFSPFAGLGPVNARLGYGDENFMAHPNLRPIRPVVHSLDAPLPWRRDSAAFVSEVQHLARAFGY